MIFWANLKLNKCADRLETRMKWPDFFNPKKVNFGSENPNSTNFGLGYPNSVNFGSRKTANSHREPRFRKFRIHKKRKFASGSPIPQNSDPEKPLIRIGKPNSANSVWILFRFHPLKLFYFIVWSLAIHQYITWIILRPSPARSAGLGQLIPKQLKTRLLLEEIALSWSCNILHASIFMPMDRARKMEFFVKKFLGLTIKIRSYGQFSKKKVGVFFFYLNKIWAVL